MPVSVTVYRVVALVLWAGVSVLASYATGVYFALEGRQIVFPSVLFVGLYLLVLVGIYGEFSPRTRGRESLRRLHMASVRGSADKRVLFPEEVRQWLDDFLVRHQRGKRN